MTKEKIKHLLKEIERKSNSFSIGAIVGILSMTIIFMLASSLMKGKWCSVLKCQPRFQVSTQSAMMKIESTDQVIEEAEPTIISDKLKIVPVDADGIYTIQEGDCLWNIAQEKLGDATRWVEIYELNKDVIGSNPNLIHPNVILQLPGS